MVPRDIHGTPTLLYTHLPGPNDNDRFDFKPKFIFTPTSVQYSSHNSQSSPLNEFPNLQQIVHQKSILNDYSNPSVSKIQNNTFPKENKPKLSVFEETPLDFNANFPALSWNGKTDSFQEKKIKSTASQKFESFFNTFPTKDSWSSVENPKQGSVKFLHDLIQNSNFFKERLNQDVDFKSEIQNIKLCLEFIESWKLGEQDSQDLDNFCLDKLRSIQNIKEFNFDEGFMTDQEMTVKLEECYKNKKLSNHLENLIKSNFLKQFDPIACEKANDVLKSVLSGTLVKWRRNELGFQITTELNNLMNQKNGLEKIFQKVKSNSIPKLNLSKLLEGLYEKIEQYSIYLKSFSGSKSDHFELFCLMQNENQNLKKEINKLKDLVSHIMKQVKVETMPHDGVFIYEE
jgi:hypothetical protein